MTEEIERISQENDLCRRLLQIPGFGPLVSTATVAAIGNGAAFCRGRDFAAWVGVVPRQYSHRRKAEAVRHQQARQHLFASHDRSVIHGRGKDAALGKPKTLSTFSTATTTKL